MCKLTRQEFSLCRQCKGSIVNRTDIPPRNLLDELIPLYGIDIIKIVLAATVLNNDTVLHMEFPPDTLKWAKKYENKVGFLSESVGLHNASLGKTNQLIYLLNKIKS